MSPRGTRPRRPMAGRAHPGRRPGGGRLPCARRPRPRLRAAVARSAPSCARLLRAVRALHEQHAGRRRRAASPPEAAAAAFAPKRRSPRRHVGVEVRPRRPLHAGGDGRFGVGDSATKGSSQPTSPRAWARARAGREREAVRLAAGESRAPRAAARPPRSTPPHAPASTPSGRGHGGTSLTETYGTQVASRSNPSVCWTHTRTFLMPTMNGLLASRSGSSQSVLHSAWQLGAEEPSRRARTRRRSSACRRPRGGTRG